MKLLLSVLLASFAGHVTSEMMAAAPTPLRVMSVNIRLDTPSDGENRWALRAAALARQISGYAPDIFGAQEVLPSQWDDLRRLLPEFASVGAGRERDGGGEASPVFFRTKRFALVDSGTFWLSTTPDVPGSKGWDAALPRVCSWAVLRENGSGRELLVANAHFDHLGHEARLQSARLILHQLEELNTVRRPVVFTGDLNTAPDTAPVEALIAGGLTCVDLVAAERSGAIYSFQGFGGAATKYRQLIDYVFVSGPLVARTFRVADEKVDDRYTSDHYPVVTTLDWSQ
jgi:endonuclease/exonuclease/phosphatase family metal-dependent hydrolase